MTRASDLGSATGASDTSAGSGAPRAVLALADGRVFQGRAWGALEKQATGELVFNTSMTGYQEILSDPSYHGQLVTMTYPEIGNVGVNPQDEESSRPSVRGFIVRNYSGEPSNWRAQRSLSEYLVSHGIPGIAGIDTRALVQHIRSHGAQQAVLSTAACDVERLVDEASRAPAMQGMNLVRQVSCREPYEWTAGSVHPNDAPRTAPDRRLRVVAYDFGVKHATLRRLVDVGCTVTVVPHDMPAAEVLKMGPHGVFLSNGPGDPAAVPEAIESVRGLLGRLPVFGICLGHQLIGLALGARSYKLPFGHHGGNHPVKDLATGRVNITSQNHCFALDAQSLEGRARVTHLSLNDRTVEGLAVDGQPTFSVQYHPEASPGPHDAAHLFERFAKLMGEHSDAAS